MFKLLSRLLLSVSVLVPISPLLTSSASAACVMTDVSVQIAIHGSKNPAKQTNNVDMQSEGVCVGNTTTSTSTQIYVGPGDVEQTRNSSHFVGGGTNNGTNIGGPTIRVPVHVPVDVYNPAYDPNFLGSLPQSSNAIPTKKY